MNQFASLQTRMAFGDEADAIAYWAGKPWKKYAIDVTAGPYKRPTFRRTVYAGAASAAEAIETAKRNMLNKPSRARYQARLAGPAELGCTRKTA